MTTRGSAHAHDPIFFLLARREAWHLFRGGPRVWTPRANGSAITTSVVRVPGDLGARLRQAVLPARDEPGRHYVYPAEDLHVTLVNLDAYREVPLERIHAALADALSRAGPVTLGLRGLAVSRSTVFARVYVRPAAALFRLRAAVHRSLAGPVVPRDPADLVGFCNVMRFGHRDISAASAVAARCRDIDFGRFPIREVEIVRTDKVLSAANTVVLATCARKAR